MTNTNQPMKNTGTQIISDVIEHEGVDHVFFVDAVLRHTLIEIETRGVKRILAHSEKSAAYMADGYARASGKLGICMAQSVGAANLAAGLQDAYLDRVPLLAITGRKPDSHQNRNAYQEIPHGPLFEPVTKFSTQIRSVEELPRLLGQAIRESRSGTPRPVHLDLDGLKGHLVEEGTYTGSIADLNFVQSGRVGPTPPNPNDITAAAALLEKAERPMLVCGVSSLYAQAGAAIADLAIRHGIPIATTVGGRSVVETSHANHFGVIGTYSAPYANACMAAADLLIFVGSHMGDQATCDWTIPAADVPVIQIDNDPAELGRTHPTVTGLAGDLSLACNALADAAKARAMNRTEWLIACLGEAKLWYEKAIAQAQSKKGPIPAERLAYELGRALPENGIVVADTGFSATWTAQLTEFSHPGQTYLRAAGSLGWAFPAALGAACGAPDRPVVCFTGDGAFYYHMGELETAKRWNIPLVTIINNNSALGQGLRSVKQLYENREGQLGDLVEFQKVDFSALAKVFGITSYRVEQADDIRSTITRAITQARSNNEPVIIDVVTDASSNPQPSWKPSV